MVRHTHLKSFRSCSQAIVHYFVNRNYHPRAALAYTLLRINLYNLIRTVSIHIEDRQHPQTVFSLYLKRPAILYRKTGAYQYRLICRHRTVIAHSVFGIRLEFRIHQHSVIILAFQEFTASIHNVPALRERILVAKRLIAEQLQNALIHAGITVIERQRIERLRAAPRGNLREEMPAVAAVGQVVVHQFRFSPVDLYRRYNLFQNLSGLDFNPGHIACRETGNVGILETDVPVAPCPVLASIIYMRHVISIARLDIIVEHLAAVGICDFSYRIDMACLIAVRKTEYGRAPVGIAHIEARQCPAAFHFPRPDETLRRLKRESVGGILPLQQPHAVERKCAPVGVRKVGTGSHAVVMQRHVDNGNGGNTRYAPSVSCRALRALAVVEQRDLRAQAAFFRYCHRHIVNLSSRRRDTLRKRNFAHSHRSIDLRGHYCRHRPLTVVENRRRLVELAEIHEHGVAVLSGYRRKDSRHRGQNVKQQFHICRILRFQEFHGSGFLSDGHFQEIDTLGHARYVDYSLRPVDGCAVYSLSRRRIYLDFRRSFKFHHVYRHADKSGSGVGRHTDGYPTVKILAHIDIVTNCQYYYRAYSHDIARLVIIELIYRLPCGNRKRKC